MVVSPVTVLVNDTNPRDLLTRLCDTMATERLHGVVFEDDVGSGAGAQVKMIYSFFGFLIKHPLQSHGVQSPTNVFPKAAHGNIFM